MKKYGVYSVVVFQICYAILKLVIKYAYVLIYLE